MEQRALDSSVRNEASSSTGVLVECVRGREAFLKRRSAWDEALLTGNDPSPALEHDFLRLWLEHFAPGSTPLTLLSSLRGRLAAALGVLIGQESVDGVPARLCRTWTNSHSTRGGLVLGVEADEGLGPLVARLIEENWDVLELRDLPREGGILDSVEQFLRAGALRTHVDRPMQSPYILLPASLEEFEKRLDSKFRQNLRRRRRRLEEQGPVTVELIEGLDDLDPALEEAYALEARGWKGRSGSAIRERPETAGFYAAWARELARAGRLRLSFLKVGDKRIAFHFAHVTRGRYHLPKCGFDEGWRECSPGQLLMHAVLARCIEEGVESFEFLGHPMTWKRDWTPLVRPHATLWAFRRNVTGTAAWAARAKGRPLALQAWKRMRAAADWGLR